MIPVHDVVTMRSTSRASTPAPASASAATRFPSAMAFSR